MSYVTIYNAYRLTDDHHAWSSDAKHRNDYVVLSVEQRKNDMVVRHAKPHAERHAGYVAVLPLGGREPAEGDTLTLWIHPNNTIYGHAVNGQVQSYHPEICRPRTPQEILAEPR